MLSIAERHRFILDSLNKNGFIKVAEISTQLGVTKVTVRKDLKLLEKKGLLYRTHGSASPVNPHTGDRNVSEKEKINISEKKRIGIAAAQLIDENDSIIMNSGSTVCAFAEQLEAKGTLMAVTASLKSTLIMSENANINILQLGGNYRMRSMSVISNYTLGFLDNINCSKLFLGVDGVDPNFGVTTSTIEEAELNKAMMDISLKTIVLCDSTKFGKKGFGKICNLDKIDIIITDSGASKSWIKILENAGIEVIIA